MLNRIGSLLSFLSRKKSYSSKAGMCCIAISSKELTLVYTREIQGKITIELCESHPYINNFVPLLTTLVKNNQLKGVTCSLMLQPEDYQLLVTDVLPVTAAEFQAAIRWKIKDLIHFPLDDVAIDSFEMPKMKINQNKIMVIVAQASKLKTISDQISSCDLNLKLIDIPELGLRNMTSLYEKDEDSVVLIYVQENTTNLLITSQQEIYVSRNVKLSLQSDDANAITQGIDRLASEIQRSLNYYQSLWDKPTPARFIFASSKPIGQDAIELLSQKVKVHIEPINMTDTLTCIPKMNFVEQGKYLPVIGGSLRESNK